jgi:predicted HNH restriction endonuclease
MSTYTESDLIVPATAVIAEHPNGISTSELLRILRAQLKPSGDDLTILDNRNDDKFSQKVRNLKSHETLEKKGLATFDNGQYHITSTGQKLAEAGAAEIARALKAQGFSEAQQQAALDRNYDGIVIEEGDRTAVNRSLVRRSSLLKKLALRRFADQNGSIACVGCGFRAEDKYGPTAIGLIEIHHLRPLFLTGKSRASIDVALQSVVPLCPNCHRVVHIDSSKCIAIPELKLLISSQRQTIPAH